MEYIKVNTKILVKNDQGKIVQVVPETEATSVMIGNATVADKISALESGKADATHVHEISDITTLQTELNGKNPLMDEVSNEEILSLLNA